MQKASNNSTGGWRVSLGFRNRVSAADRPASQKGIDPMRKIVSAFAVVVVVMVIGVVAPGRSFADGTVLTWSSRASMSAPRYSAAVASTLDGDIVVFGGLAH